MSAAAHHSPDRLAALLEAQGVVFTELADLAVAQRQALLSADETALLDLAGRAETLATRFRLIEDERGRLERAQPSAGEGAVGPARVAMKAALTRLLRETAISGTILERLGDDVATREAAVGALFGAAYLPDGRTGGRRIAGTALSAEV